MGGGGGNNLRVRGILHPPLIPPASYALTYVLEAMLSGAPPLGGEIPLRPPLAFYSSFINNINAYANPFTISVLAISLSLFAASPP